MRLCNNSVSATEPLISSPILTNHTIILKRNTLKSDEEIKDFIDSRKALTKRELSVFIYGQKSGNPRVDKFWGYVLETKNWKDLKEYQRKKNRLDIFENFKKIYKKDKRLQENGIKNITKLLKEIYNIKLSYSTLSKYLNILRK